MRPRMLRHGCRCFQLWLAPAAAFDDLQQDPARSPCRCSSTTKRSTRPSPPPDWRCGSGGQPARCSHRADVGRLAPASRLARRPPVAPDTGATAGHPTGKSSARSSLRLLDHKSDSAGSLAASRVTQSPSTIVAGGRRRRRTRVHLGAGVPPTASPAAPIVRVAVALSSSGRDWASTSWFLCDAGGSVSSGLGRPLADRRSGAAVLPIAAPSYATEDKLAAWDSRPEGGCPRPGSSRGRYGTG